ncbi:hypothetical protein J6590_081941 [Homalodisca vitripennis]|nr:hypothetical protein J6590_081941 [Homalodisca vitripennis]
MSVKLCQYCDCVTRMIATDRLVLSSFKVIDQSHTLFHASFRLAQNAQESPKALSLSSFSRLQNYKVVALGGTVNWNDPVQSVQIINSNRFMNWLHIIWTEVPAHFMSSMQPQGGRWYEGNISVKQTGKLNASLSKTTFHLAKCESSDALFLPTKSTDSFHSWYPMIGNLKSTSIDFP